MTKTDEAFQEAVLALREWLDYLAERKRETTEQLERARRRVDSGSPASVDVVVEESLSAAADGGPESWL